MILLRLICTEAANYRLIFAPPEKVDTIWSAIASMSFLFGISVSENNGNNAWM